MEYISSPKNAKIMEFAKLVKDKKERKKSGLFVCEGLVMLKEALANGAKVSTIVLSEDFTQTLPETNAKILQVPHHIIEKISDTKTPQGLMFSCEINESDALELENMSKILILDNVSDPGNVGTLLRSAVSFGVEGVVLLSDTADTTSPKVVRSTMGAIFKIKIFKTDIKTCFNHIKVPVFATYLDDESIDIRNTNLEKSAIILGNEARGISDEVLKYATKKIIIPMKNTESLNVSIAGSIALWEAFSCQK